MFLDFVFHVAEARVYVLILKAQVLRMLFGERFKLVGLRLRQVNNPPIVAEIRRCQFRMFVEPKASPSSANAVSPAKNS